MDAHATSLRDLHRTAPDARRGSPGRLLRWAVPLAFAWSLATVAWAFTWATGVVPQPFADPDAVLLGAVFNAAPSVVGIAFTLVVGAIAMGVAVAMLCFRDRPGRHGLAVEALGWLLALTLVATLLHGKMLMLLGYTPVVLTLGWFHPPLWSAYLDTLRDPEIHLQIHALAGAALWALAALTQRWARRGACPACGRRHGWSASQEAAARVAALRRGRVAVAVGSVAALLYPALRLPWLVGVPVGMDAATFAEVQATPGAVAVGIAFGLAGVAGVVLMSGLVADWGVQFPRWLPGLSGRRVPIGLAVVPAVIVALGLVALGRGVLTALGTPQLSSFVADDPLQTLAFAAMLPWGIALGIATLAYAQRRRGHCTRCDRGTPEVRPSALSAARVIAPVASSGT
jgi:hypothetical protein